ncbi:hypothetical protein FRX31_034526 [Thalictrum thalictroides]|uniref:Uncharacterized protein n=1 Tax=Thalictrum thalictroides TaxID=46969 RepID=A0A7J6UTK1_THATH|nr:hypothetical protein FRX31_034526 [Thalictrum thalictroides]
MAGPDETITHLSKTFKGSLPSFESLWIFILEIMKKPFKLASDLVCTIGDKMKEPFKVVSDFVCSIGEKLKESPLVMKIVGVTEDAANATLPYLKNIGVYCVEKIKQHPYMFGLIVLFALLLVCCCKKGCSSSSSGKMMKAPGRDYMMLRDDFEASPRSYFRELRGKGSNGRGTSGVHLC